MLDFSNQAVFDAKTAAAAPPEPTVPEVKAQPGDAILRSVPLENSEGPTRRSFPVFRRLLRLVPRVAVAGCLCGVAWAGGSYYSRGYPFWDATNRAGTPGPQQSAEYNELVTTVREMADDVGGLKTSVESLRAAQAAEPKNANNGETLKSQLDSVQATTRTAIADLAGRVDKLEADSTTKLSKLSDRLEGIEQRIPAPRAARVSAATPHRKRVEHLHDAFDPSRDPTAPGAPRPLGTLANDNRSGQHAY